MLKGMGGMKGLESAMGSLGMGGGKKK